MRLPLNILAVILLLGTAIWWVATGSHRGWSKNSVEVRTLDEITGIEQITYDKRFVAGLDTLAIGAAAAAVSAGLGWALGRRSSRPEA